jgi:hypothetical protein
MSVVMKVKRNIIGIKALKTAFAAKMWRCGWLMTLAPLSDSSRLLEHVSIVSMHTAVETVTFSNHFCWVDGGNSRPEVE